MEDRLALLDQQLDIANEILEKYHGSIKTLFEPVRHRKPSVIEDRDEFSSAVQYLSENGINLQNLGASEEIAAEYRRKILDIFLNKDVGIEYMPSSALMDKELMKELYGKNNIPHFEAICDVFEEPFYDEKIEKKFLEEVGYDSIEKYIQSVLANTTEKTTMRQCGIEAMAGFKLYGHKKCFERGVPNTMININDYLEFKRTATAKTDFLAISVNGGFVSAQEVCQTLAHEVEHFRQRKDIGTMDFESNPDIDIITYDDFLGNNSEDTIAYDYLEKNYRLLTEEYDADNKGHISAIIDGVNPKVTKGCSAPSSINTVVEINILADKAARQEYRRTYSRYEGDVLVNIYGMVDEVLQEKYDEVQLFGEESVEAFKRDLRTYWPLIALQYDISMRDCRRKSLVELVQDLETADPKTALAIKGLINARLNTKKYPATAKKDASELKKYLKEENLDEYKKEYLSPAEIMIKTKK